MTVLLLVRATAAANAPTTRGRPASPGTIAGAVVVRRYRDAVRGGEGHAPDDYFTLQADNAPVFLGQT